VLTATKLDEAGVDSLLVLTSK